MLQRRKPVGGGEALHPLLEVALVKLDNPMAVPADEMVMMRVTAEPIAHLSATVIERVDDAAIAQ
jgi:hypothetical protein